jgi:hypothetical protein
LTLVLLVWALVLEPNHREDHLGALHRLERVRRLCRHENHLAALQTMKFAGDSPKQLKAMTTEVE